MTRPTEVLTPQGGGQNAAQNQEPLSIIHTFLDFIERHMRDFPLTIQILITITILGLLVVYVLNGFVAATFVKAQLVCVVDRQLVCAGGRLARLLKGAQVSPRASAGGSEAGAAREIIPLPPQSRALSGEFPSQVPKVDIVLTGALDDVVIRHQAHLFLHLPRLGINLGVVDGNLNFHVPEVRPPETFGDVQCIGRGLARLVQPCLSIETAGVTTRVSPSHLPVE